MPKEQDTRLPALSAHFPFARFYCACHIRKATLKACNLYQNMYHIVEFTIALSRCIVNRERQMANISLSLQIKRYGTTPIPFWIFINILPFSSHVPLPIMQMPLLFSYYAFYYAKHLLSFLLYNQTLDLFYK